LKQVTKTAKVHTQPAANRPPSAPLLTRHFTQAGHDPFDSVHWSYRDVIHTDHRTGTVLFEQRNVEFPTTWSDNAVTIVTTKYFRGKLGSPQRESSLRQLVERVVSSYAQAALDHGYCTAEEAVVLHDELAWLLIHQYFAFNSPVWFNVGTSSPQQVSACFILSVDDDMNSILDWYKEEGLIFKGGSGAGVNLSKIRSSKEFLSSGGHASGPVSFMRGADASAGTIKSGGATRRAAKMVVLDVDHPDIEEFVDTKAREEDKIRALKDAGFDMSVSGKDIISVQYQNANNSVRVTDQFMRAVTDGSPFALTSRTTGQPVQEVDARALFTRIAKAAWECADPGIQYADTIAAWHTNPNTGPITASNPCSEYMSLDNSSCNLASINLAKFAAGDMFDVDAFQAAVHVIIVAMDVSISFADFPTTKIADTTRQFRQLGIGYSNLGALLMSRGLAYDSDAGRDLAAAITSLMSAAAWNTSQHLAARVGAYEGFAANAHAHNQVIGKHRDKHAQAAGNGRVSDYIDAVFAAATRQWDALVRPGKKPARFRNAQISLLAPTGTISFLMDCDTTGIEPDFALVKRKHMVDGSMITIVNQTVPAALKHLGYTPAVVDAVVAHVQQTGSVVDAPGLDPAHYPVFDCAVGDRAIEPMGHVLMMAAVQPFLSGAISKTVNLPETATVDDIEKIYMAGWRLGLKALAVYRDNCKVGQPLSDGKAAAAGTQDVPGSHRTEPFRARLPRSRRGTTTSFSIADIEGYLTAGEYDDGTLGEIFVKVSKQGSTLAGIVDGLAMAVSIGLQYGVPLQTYVSKYVNSGFEPAGLTNDPDIRMGKSILDYVFRRLAVDYLPVEVRQGMGISTVSEREALLDTQPASPPPAAQFSLTVDAPLCGACGVAMQRSGSCFCCPGCGSTSGCS